ncbi:MAG: hypothetical protein CL912_28615 [Deltaproteobacteria bacterium]|nr:hypothetical protein [Deltaproteobacteria bacterium]
MLTPSRLTRGVRSYGIDTQLDSDIADTQAIREFNNQPADFLADRATALEVEITYATLNLRDQVRKKEEIPLQFQYDAADCRIFFTPDTVINFANLWKYAADAIWNKPELCVKESTGYSNTDATDTKLPPASVLPAQAAVETSEVKLGSIINGIFNSNTGPGIEAAKGAKTAPKQTSNQVKATGPVRAEKCKVNPTTSALFCSNPNTICDNNYAYCSTLTPGKKIPRPGCVNLCPYVGMSCGTGTTGGTCMAFPGSEDQLDGTARGYCATPYRWASTKCSTASSKNAVQPGEASVPNKRRRDGDELFAEMEVA